MSPDNAPTNDAPKPDHNPTLAEDDKFRRTYVPAEGPNVDGPMNQIRDTHARPDENAPDVSGEPVKSEPAIETAMRDVQSDVEPSSHAPDAPQEG